MPHSAPSPTATASSIPTTSDRHGRPSEVHRHYPYLTATNPNARNYPTDASSSPPAAHRDATTTSTPSPTPKRPKANGLRRPFREAATTVSPSAATARTAKSSSYLPYATRTERKCTSHCSRCPWLARATMSASSTRNSTAPTTGRTSQRSQRTGTARCR